MDRSATSDSSAPALRGTWLDASAAERLHARAGAARWGLTVDRFHETLARVAAKVMTGRTLKSLGVTTEPWPKYTSPSFASAIPTFERYSLTVMPPPARAESHR